MKRYIVAIIVLLWAVGLALFWSFGGPKSRELADWLVHKASKTLREGNYASVDELKDDSKPESAAFELTGVDDDLSHLAGTTTPQSIAPMVEFLSQQESRFTGYPGNLATAEFIKDQFFEIFGEENVLVEKRPATVPYEEYSRVAFLGDGEEVWDDGLNVLHPFSVKLHTFKNGAVEGHLVYGGDGDLANLNGRDLDGAIVLLDFKSGDSFMTLRSFGARAFIFLYTGEITYRESITKSPDIPIDAPAFFAGEELSKRLLDAEKNGQQVRLETKSEWKEVEVANFVGVFPGSPEEMPGYEDFEYTRKTWDENVLVVSGFYDSPSVVPAKAPGRTNAASIIGLLESARAVQRQRDLDNGNKFRMVFVAYTGHFQAYEGIIDFLRRHARINPNYRKFIPEEHRLDPRLIFSLEMTDADPRVLVTHLGNGVLWGGNWVIEGKRSALGFPFQRIAHTFQGYSARIYGEDSREDAMDGVKPKDRNFPSFFPVEQGAFASDVCNFVASNSVALTTPDDPRALVNTPADTLDKLNVENVVAQANILGPIFCAASRDALFFERANLKKYKDVASDIVGAAVWYDVKSNFATPSGRLDGGVAMYSRFFHHTNIRWGVRGQRFQKLRFNEPSGGDADLGYEVKLN